MPNYFDQESENVKKFWEDRKEYDKNFWKLYCFIAVIIGLFMLLFLGKLNITILSAVTILGFWWLFELIHYECRDLTNRINISEEHMGKLSTRIWKIEHSGDEFYQKHKKSIKDSKK